MDELLQSIKRRIIKQSRTLCPPLSEAEVVAFEASHGVTLPEGYRRFIVEIGNGGEGPPSYGLVPLASWPHSPEEPEAAYWERLPDLARPFPFTKPWIWEDGEISQEGTEDQIRHGNLILGTKGCGQDWHLIVTGREGGNVWLVTGEGMFPTTPKRDFLAWYSDWLDGKVLEDWGL